MQDQYVNAFFNLLQEKKSKFGFSLPDPLEVYTVMLLAHFLDKKDFLPKKTFAQSYLELNNTDKSNAKKLGDICLFMTGVFPEYNNHKGFSVKYYSEIGKSSYQIAMDYSGFSIFNMLTKNFDFVRNYISFILNKTNSTYKP